MINRRNQRVAAEIEHGIQADNRLFTANYFPPVKRIHEFGSFPRTVQAMEDILGDEGITPGKRQLSLSATEAMLLNPNVDLSENRGFVVKPEHKGLLLESLVKAVIGNTPGLGPDDFKRVAGKLADGRLFADGQGHPVDKILTPLIQEPGLQAGDKKGNYWASDRSEMVSMGEDRKYWWQAEHNLITRNLREYAAPAKKGENLEVGAGWGDFHWLCPDWFRTNMVSVEWNPMFVTKFKDRFPDASVRQGNIYKLDRKRFPDESVSNVIGLTPFSSLWNLDHATKEMWRVLKPGGRFFSFHDQLPNDEQVVDQLLNRGMVPDPSHVLFFRSEKDRNEVSESLSHVGQEFGGPAWKAYKKVFHRNARVQNLYEYHEQWLATELKYRGFNILKQADDVETWIGPRQERHQRLCGNCSMDHNRDIGMFHYGNARGPFMEPHPVNYTVPYRLLGGDVAERIVVWTMVAEKPGGPKKQPEKS
ncbi:class I SAM-dependent methyltransferase [Candidatus Altiarchaeota archaeon]